jgi:AcrR family transcriptional regulator
LNDRIMRAAISVIAEVGFEGLSLEEVARRAGTAKTSLYRRWPGKDALTIDAVEHYLTAVKNDAAQPAPDTGSLRGDLVAYAMALGRLFTAERTGVIAGLLLATRSHPVLRERVRDRLARREGDALVTILMRAQKRGEVSGPATSLWPLVIPAMLFARAFLLGDPPDARFTTHVVDDVLLPVLRGSGTAPRPSRARRKTA